MVGRISFVILMTLFANSSSASATSTFDGEYISIDGSLTYRLTKSGEFSGDYVDTSNPKNNENAVGVYEAGNAICGLRNGLQGNILLHYEQHKCCLFFKNIGEKIAATMIYSPYMNISSEGYGVCKNQVFVSSRPKK
jgi:hypothetical protein